MEKNIEDNSATYIETLITLDKQYLRLPVEMKISAFKPEVLEEIEKAYQLVGDITQFFDAMYPKYKRGEVTYSELINSMSTEIVLQWLQAAEKTLKKEINQ